jgi:hypothetical protein
LQKASNSRDPFDENSKPNWKRLKVWWFIKGEIAYIQDEEPKWKRRPTSGLTFEFSRDAIELILENKIAIEDLIE